ncbi:hypothetical protein [Paenibacillus daejeonensis]|uniref:hypothetical protein n=1 Tax=Paenibacillus daejeonensis TaxID=135193 RepID=UPI00036F7405|nr:hypothetical protein [Paenibacillus daejeonensis]
MAYPNKIDVFYERLNKNPTGNPYVIEEQLKVIDGSYNGPLRHDNINNQTIRVYTGPRLTGEQITNWTISVPSNTPWRRLIRIFSSEAEVYVTYETPGDTVEADDVNELQTAVTSTQIEVERYKSSNDSLVSDTRQRLETAERSKSDQTYVDSQLLTKADKATTYTREQTDARIQSVIGAAPDALDTLQEIAEALNNDPDFAGTMTTQLASKVDKVIGKGLSTEDYTTVEQTKLAGIAARAGTSGSATDAVIGNRTISDTTAAISDTGTLSGLLGGLAHAMKAITGGANWRSLPSITLEVIKTLLDEATHVATAGTLLKRDGSGRAKVAAPAAADDIARKAEVDTVATAVASAIDKADNAQSELNIHIEDGVRHLSSAERNSWNAKASTAIVTSATSGLMSAVDKTKLDGVASGANNYTHPVNHPPSIITQDAGNRFVSDVEKANWNSKETITGAQSKVDSHANDAVRHITAAERTTWNAKQAALGFTPENVSRRGAANGYAELDAVGKIPDNRISSTFVTQSQLGGAGYGDMTKSVYDTNDNGKIDAAEAADTVPWLGVSGKPATFAPNAHDHARLQRIDDRDRKPVDTVKGYAEAVFTSLGGMTGGSNSVYQDMLVLNTYTDSSGGLVNALVFDKSTMTIRHYQATQGATSWGSPKILAYADNVIHKGALTWAQLRGDA